MSDGKCQRLIEQWLPASDHQEQGEDKKNVIESVWQYMEVADFEDGEIAVVRYRRRIWSVSS